MCRPTALLHLIYHGDAHVIAAVNESNGIRLLTLTSKMEVKSGTFNGDFQQSPHRFLICRDRIEITHACV
jgi:hypothetical protein